MKILTIDLEDWFHINFDKNFYNEASWSNFESRIERNTEIILQLLHNKNIKGTFFCLGWVAYKYPNLIKKIYENGHEIACHSFAHNLITKQDKQSFRSDLLRALDSIESVTGEKVKIYRAPAFSIGENNLWALEVLIENGIKIDSSIFPAHHHFGGFPNLKSRSPYIYEFNGMYLKEFPMSTKSVLGKEFVLTGGGYFRLFPYSMIKNYIEGSDYIMTYFHPRDFDPQQPMVPGLGISRKFKSYVGLSGAYKKLEFLLKEHQFINVDMAVESVNWNNVDKVVLK